MIKETETKHSLCNHGHALAFAFRLGTDTNNSRRLLGFQDLCANLASNKLCVFCGMPV